MEQNAKVFTLFAATCTPLYGLAVIVIAFCIVAYQFGCHSGLTYEKRVARAYSMGQLSSKRGAEPKPICLTCATVGHTYKNCPEGF